jgi:hypothetical protein
MVAIAAGMEASMSALTWGADTGYAGHVPLRRPHLVVLPGAGERPAAPRGLRVTRRGRIALLALVLVLAGALGFAGLRAAGAAQPARVVTVEAGQTLSEIAATELPNHTIGAGIVAIQVANGLSTAQVNAGQELVIPEG